MTANGQKHYDGRDVLRRVRQRMIMVTYFDDKQESWSRIEKVMTQRTNIIAYQNDYRQGTEQKKKKKTNRKANAREKH